MAGRRQAPLETLWLHEFAPHIRIGLKTGRVIAFDRAYELILVEWDDNSGWETHELAWMHHEFVATVRDAVAKREEHSA